MQDFSISFIFSNDVANIDNDFLKKKLQQKQTNHILCLINKPVDGAPQ